MQTRLLISQHQKRVHEVDNASIDSRDAMLCPSSEVGWQTTISHPANVNNILASGVDTLVISLNIDWRDTALFAILDEVKEKAKQYSLDYAGHLQHFNPEEVWPFTIKPHGTKGFSWILIGSDFSYKIANSSAPGSRPNAMIEIRSEALWRLGPKEVIKIALSLIEANGGHIIEAKPSRVDLCVDFLMPEALWSSDLMEYAVTRASDFAPYYRFKKLTGIRIGKGVISARLYDKPLEIQQQSRKVWMFDIWGLKEVPEGKKIIRIEFQMRREVLKQLGLRKVEDLFQKIDQAWAYCTKSWLKFQDRPGLHHTQRTTFDWYEEIQNGFAGVQGAEPLVREKAVRIDKKRLLQQINGCAISLHAIRQEEEGADLNATVNINDCVISYVEELEKNRHELPDIQERSARKRAKYHRLKPEPEPGKTVYILNKEVRLPESKNNDKSPKVSDCDSNGISNEYDKF
jgi:hypothetical protein